MRQLIDKESLIEAFENLDWYHINNGKLVHGATSKDGLYKQDDVYQTINEAPPVINSDDAVSRQAALEALFELYEYQRAIDPTEAADLVRQGIYLACKKIEQLPPVQHWTLCSDHLPDCGEEVMTVNDDDEYLVNHIIDDVNGEWFYDGAIAWAPITKYKR